MWLSHGYPMAFLVGSTSDRPPQATLNANYSHSALKSCPRKVYIKQALSDCQLLIIEMRENAAKIAQARR
jgi:hypothetical protein